MIFLDKSKETKDNSKSLFLYTGLIFLVALIMIIISFFGQSNLEKTNQAIQDQKSISEKAAAISEENMKLVERNIELETQLSQKTEEINNLNKVIENSNSVIEQYNSLMDAYSLVNVKNFDGAKKSLQKVDFESLDGDAKILYTEINDILHDTE